MLYFVQGGTRIVSTWLTCAKRVARGHCHFHLNVNDKVNEEQKKRKVSSPYALNLTYFSSAQFVINLFLVFLYISWSGTWAPGRPGPATSSSPVPACPQGSLFQFWLKYIVDQPMQKINSDKIRLHPFSSLLATNSWISHFKDLISTVKR